MAYSDLVHTDILKFIRTKGVEVKKGTIKIIPPAAGSAIRALEVRTTDDKDRLFIAESGHVVAWDGAAWRTVVYLGGGYLDMLRARLSTTILPDADATRSIGSASLALADVFVTRLRKRGAATFLALADPVEVYGNGIPSADNAWDWGTNARRWRTVRAVSVVTGDLTLKRRNVEWKIEEKLDGLYVRNMKTGKLYRIVLKEVK